MGFQILVHSIKMVLNNLKEALQITLVPAAVGVFGLAILISAMGGLEALGTPGAEVGAGFAGALLLMVAGYWAIILWIFVSWHRFILLEEYPQGWIPPFRFDRILSYFGHSVLLALAGGLVFVCAGLVFFVVAAVSEVLAGLLAIVGIILLVPAIYRLIIVLPAAAIGKPLRLSEAWNATEGSFGTIIVLLIASFLFQVLVQLVLGLFGLIPVIGPLLVLIPSVLVLPLINVSILTTLYGVYVEGRQIG